MRLFDLAMLPVTIGVDQPQDISRHLFPVTPPKPHSSYLERIIAMHDGNYGWSGAFDHRL